MVAAADLDQARALIELYHGRSPNREVLMGVVEELEWSRAMILAAKDALLDASLLSCSHIETHNALSAVSWALWPDPPDRDRPPVPHPDEDHFFQPITVDQAKACEGLVGRYGRTEEFIK